jgi:hypothetical protein
MGLRQGREPARISAENVGAALPYHCMEPHLQRPGAPLTGISYVLKLLFPNETVRILLPSML